MSEAVECDKQRAGTPQNSNNGVTAIHWSHTAKLKKSRHIRHGSALLQMSEAAACDKQRAGTPSVNSNGVPALRLSHPTENKCVAVEQLFHGLAIVDVIHQAERSVVH
jgi:hypothetical protein